MKNSICKVLGATTIRPLAISADSENAPTTAKKTNSNSNAGDEAHSRGSGDNIKKTDERFVAEMDLESEIRSSIFTKLLADIDPLVESSSATGKTVSSSQQRNASVMTSFETATSIKNKKTHSAFSASLWGRSDNSTLSLTESELRRRDDFYLAFSVAVIVGSCRDSDNK